LATGEETGVIPFTKPADNIKPDRYIVVFRGRLGNENGAVIGKVNASWNEEWDNGLHGNHAWLHGIWANEGDWHLKGEDVGVTVADGKFIKDNAVRDIVSNLSYVGEASRVDSNGHCYYGIYQFDCAFARGFPYPITSGTSIRLKIDAMDVDQHIPPEPCAWAGTPVSFCQGIGLGIKMGTGQTLKLNFTTPGNECYTVYDMLIPVNTDYSIRLYDVLESIGPVVEPVTITYISIQQSSFCGSFTTVQQHMEVDYIRIEE